MSMEGGKQESFCS